MKVFFQAALVLLCSNLTLQAHAELYGFSEVDQGLYRGSRPFTDEDYRELKNAGIKTILTLQSAPWSISPERKKAEKNGFTLISLPIFAFTPVVSTPRVIEILETMQMNALKPLYVHCRYGRDRTGLAVGMYRIHVQKWTPEAAYSEMKQFGFRPYFVWGIYEYFKSHTSPDSLTIPAGDGELLESF